MVEMRNKEPIAVKKKPNEVNKLATTINSRAGKEEEDGNYEFSVDEAKGNINLKNLEINDRMSVIKNSRVFPTDDKESAL
jgi:uncharacterized protein with FMN-binding domain